MWHLSCLPTFLSLDWLSISPFNLTSQLLADPLALHYLFDSSIELCTRYISNRILCFVREPKAAFWAKHHISETDSR